MSTSVMKRLTLVALSGDADKLMRRLMWLRCVEVETGGGDETGLAHASFDAERSELMRRAALLSGAITTLGKYKASKKKLLSGRLEVERNRFDGDVATALKTAEETAAASARLAELGAARNKKESDIAALSVWGAYDAPLELGATQDMRITLGTLPSGISADDARASMPEEAQGLFEIEELSRDARSAYIAVYEHTSCGTRVQRALSALGFSKTEFREFTGTPLEAQAKCKEELGLIDDERADVTGKLKSLAGSIAELEIAYDVTRTALAAAEAKSKLLCTQNTVYLTGWVPQQCTEKVAHALEGFDCWYEFTDPGEDDNPPVLLRNNAWASPFEGVVAMYSLPRYGSFDPTFIMSIFYFVIFGLMLADVGYGLILSLGCFAALRLLKPRGGTKQLMQMFMICGISCIVAGVAFGSYFGDIIDKIANGMFGSSFTMPRLLDPTNDPMSFLILSLVMGVIHLMTGMGVRFYILCREGKVFSAIFDVGSWYVLFAGIGLFLVVPDVGKWVALAGVAMLVLTQGRGEKNPIMWFLKGVLSLYDLVSYISDLLSYSRIMALGLASAVIASVVNQIGVMGGWVGIVIALLLGHTLNLAINMLGTYVHTSRLQYIEFFGKFFEDGGRPFDPVKPDMKYTDIPELPAA